MRLIDADILPKYTGTALSAVDVARAVENAQTIDPAENGGCWGCQCALCGQYPVKRGEWIYDKGLYRCNACNNLLTVAGWDIPEEQIYKSFKFCPNCGAKMDLIL